MDGTSLQRVGESDGSDPLLDVVFVHGLSIDGSDGSRTWSTRHAGSSWLEWLAADLPEGQIWSLVYPAAATKWTDSGRGMSLPERASNVIPTLIQSDIGSRPLVFVCHSLGGLVVKQILRHSESMEMEEWAPIAERTVGVVFLATPHAGSTLATLAQVVRLTRATRTTMALTSHCPHLKELGDWYRQKADSLKIDTIAFSESCKTPRRLFLKVLVVSPTSADPGVPNCITTPLDVDHSTISKPKSRDSNIYRHVRSFLQKHIREAGVAIGPHLPVVETLTSLPKALVKDIREVEYLGKINLLSPAQVSEVKVGIVKQHYGVHDA